MYQSALNEFTTYTKRYVVLEDGGDDAGILDASDCAQLAAALGTGFLWGMRQAGVHAPPDRFATRDRRYFKDLRQSRLTTRY